MTVSIFVQQDSSRLLDKLTAYAFKYWGLSSSSFFSTYKSDAFPCGAITVTRDSAEISIMGGHYEDEENLILFVHDYAGNELEVDLKTDSIGRISLMKLGKAIAIAESKGFKLR